MHTRLLKGLFLGFLMWSAPLAAAKEVLEFSMRGPEGEVGMGQPFEIEIELRRATTQNTIHNGEISIPGLENFQETGTSSSSNTQMINHQLAFLAKITKTLVAPNPGNFTIGPAKLPTRDENGKDIVLETNSIAVQVVPQIIRNIPPPASKIASPAPEAEASDPPPAEVTVEITTPNMFFWGQVAAGFGLLIWLFLWHRRRRRRQYASSLQDTPAKKKIVPENPFPTTKDKLFFEKIRTLALEYAHKALEIEAESMTSDQIIEYARAHLPEKKIGDLTAILEAYKKQKFAKLDIDRQEILTLTKRLFNP